MKRFLVTGVAVMTMLLPAQAYASQPAAAGHRPGTYCRPGWCRAPEKWKITGISPRVRYTQGAWHDCGRVKPEPLMDKSYTCSFTGSVGNSYGATIGVSAEIVSAAVNYSVTYTRAITGGTTYTPIDPAHTYGEIQWTSQYRTRSVFEKLFSEDIALATHTGWASYWNQPLTRFEPLSPNNPVLSSTSGSFSHTHWSCPAPGCPSSGR